MGVRGVNLHRLPVFFGLLSADGRDGPSVIVFGELIDQLFRVLRCSYHVIDHAINGLSTPLKGFADGVPGQLSVSADGFGPSKCIDSDQQKDMKIVFRYQIRASRPDKSFSFTYRAVSLQQHLISWR